MQTPKTVTETQLRSLISEHESDYWLALANGWGGSEELAETIERLREKLGGKID
jgi:hypothetical protein